KIKKIKIRT
ncbi:Pantothenate kinase, partial [Haemophilus influenzae]